MFQNILKAATCAVYIYYMFEVKRAAEQQDTAGTVYHATYAICALITAFNQ